MNPSLVLSFYFNILFFSYQYTRNWLRLSARVSRIIEDFFYVATAPRQVHTTERLHIAVLVLANSKEMRSGK